MQDRSRELHAKLMAEHKLESNEIYELNRIDGILLESDPEMNWIKELTKWAQQKTNSRLQSLVLVNVPIQIVQFMPEATAVWTKQNQSCIVLTWKTKQVQRCAKDAAMMLWNREYSQIQSKMTTSKRNNQ